ncbi:MAG TPA: 5-methyltetrahydropteroyltriglutamate--homocysteine S-methyltransferase [Polyangia bacterium]|nr:5-methyltetrahydropteroyltriglutamate--homocysteine S-methyltransferase [Polyangia bacterium]
MALAATCLGFPRVGADRELKKALEAFWAGTLSGEALAEVGRGLRARHWSAMKAAGMSEVPTNDFSFYDHLLDAAVMVGAVPARYAAIADPLARYFAMARGLQDPAAGVDLPALEMTKWFDTNYHYIVPEIAPGQAFRLDAARLLGELEEARACGVEPRPVLVGPVTFLRLAKPAPGAAASASPLDALDRLVQVYQELLATLAGRVGWVQIDEPALVLDLDGPTAEAYRRAYGRLTFSKTRPKLLLASYFGDLGPNLDLALGLGCEGLHVDLARAPGQLEAVLGKLGPTTALSLGLVDGRNVWRADLDRASAQVAKAVAGLGRERVRVASSCSFLHVPVDLALEGGLDAELRSWLAFAVQKLDEIVALASAADGERTHTARFDAAHAALAARRASPRTRDERVRARLAAVTPLMLRRQSAYPERAARQRTRFGLPPLPTTTIGSFPQTRDVREVRAAWRAGRISPEAYRQFLKEETRRCVAEQEAIGLDVLVHGEFERTDMAEYFGEQLQGFAFTRNGWVQSYGSRCVKPPVIFGDVSRPGPMTVEWTRYAQSLTKRPMKGMLTGPVTILQWSFVRDDQPRAETCAQIALALRDEVNDLEAAGVGMIQVDEPAIREGLPLRRADWAGYLRWAVDAFRLATAGVRDQTQIHTHMCYAEFGDILEAIAALDADVLSIETSRSKMELFRDFGRSRYPNEVGPGVYDIHAPRVPTPAELDDLLARAARVLPAERLWVNPDCGLKTRGWPEVRAALTNMVEAARRARRALATGAR